MCFHDADDDIFSAAEPANAFAQHAEGFADARSIAEKKLEAAVLFFLRAVTQPVFRRFSGWIKRFGHAVRYLS